jgi:hypothetical protein
VSSAAHLKLAHMAHRRVSTVSGGLKKMQIESHVYIATILPYFMHPAKLDLLSIE